MLSVHWLILVADSSTCTVSGMENRFASCDTELALSVIQHSRRLATRDTLGCRCLFQRAIATLKMLTSPPRALRKNLMVVSRWLVLADSAGYGSSPYCALAEHLL